MFVYTFRAIMALLLFLGIIVLIKVNHCKAAACSVCVYDYCQTHSLLCQVLTFDSPHEARVVT